jgi:hypothetical protein
MCLSREQFTDRFPDLILVGDGALKGSIGGMSQTGTHSLLPALSWDDVTGVKRDIEFLPSPILRSVRRPSTGRDRVTVGRGPDNDVVISDDSVSKLHAYFRVMDGRLGLALSDAGSTNGTWVGERRLSPSGEPREVAPGTRIRFARVELTAVASGAFWDRLR